MTLFVVMLLPCLDCSLCLETLELSDERPRPFLLQKATERSLLVALRQAKGFLFVFEDIETVDVCCNKE